jgi:hypothetical protein
MVAAAPDGSRAARCVIVPRPAVAAPPCPKRPLQMRVCLASADALPDGVVETEPSSAASTPNPTQLHGEQHQRIQAELGE